MPGAGSSRSHLSKPQDATFFMLARNGQSKNEFENKFLLIIASKGIT
jgi:hypothetical protein